MYSIVYDWSVSLKSKTERPLAVTNKVEEKWETLLLGLEASVTTCSIAKT